MGTFISYPVICGSDEGVWVVLNMPVNIALNVYSLIILFFIYVNGRKHIDHAQIQDKLYLALLWITAFLLVVDLFSRFDGRPGTLYPCVNFWGNLLIYMLSPDGHLRRQWRSLASVAPLCVVLYD